LEGAEVMAEEYIQDPELLRQLNEEYIQDPALLAQLEGEKGVVDKLTNSPLAKSYGQELAAWWEERNKPNQPEPFDLATSAKRVGTSTAIGAGIGAVIPVVGPIAGAASGLVSGVAGEVGRGLGMSDVNTFGMEMLGGEVPQAVSAGAKAISKVVSPADYRTGRTFGIFENERLKEESVNQVKKNYFGKPAFDIDFVPTYTEDFQAATKEALGIPISNPKAVSSIVRQRLYADIENTQGTAPTFSSLGLQQGSTRTGFITSPEHKELINRLSLLRKTNNLSDKESKALNNILKLEVDPNPAVREKFVDEITNYIQNGGSYEVSKIDGKPQIAQKINTKVQRALRDSFDKYLESSLGTRKFAELKEIEAKEFTAQARDLIPSIVNSKGTIPTEDLDFILGNIKRSPEVKKEFTSALYQRLADPKFDNSDKLLREFKRYNKELVELGVFDRKGLSEFYAKLNKFDSKVQKKEVRNFILTTLTTPLVSAGVAETSADYYKNPLVPKQSRIDAFNM
jgi:hypothetical protein